MRGKASLFAAVLCPVMNIITAVKEQKVLIRQLAYMYLLLFGQRVFPVGNEEHFFTMQRAIL